jgi:DNA replication protein DnaC
MSSSNGASVRWNAAIMVHRAEAFYRLVDAATVDQLMHHAHLVESSGESHRLAEALAGRGVIPLV